MFNKPAPHIIDIVQGLYCPPPGSLYSVGLQQLAVTDKQTDRQTLQLLAIPTRPRATATTSHPTADAGTTRLKCTIVTLADAIGRTDSASALLGITKADITELRIAVIVGCTGLAIV